VIRTASAVTTARTLERLGAPPAWLGAIGEREAVERALRPHIPGLRSCQVVRVRTKSTGMTAVYLADVPGAGALELHGRVSAPHPPAGTRVEEPGWRRYLPDLRLVIERGDADAALPALRRMTDPDAAARLIERLLRASGRCPGIRVASCRPRVMRHKPGSRCTVAYELELAPGTPADWPREVVAKTYWGGKGRVAWDGMCDLWRSPVAAAGTVTLAEPLAFSADDRVVLQRSIPHRMTLKAMLRGSVGGVGDTALTAALGRTGRGLAELHVCGVRPPDERSWADERGDVGDVADRLAALVPSLDGAVARLLETVDRRLAAAGAAPAVPSHGSFRPAQVVVGERGGIGFIDFDSFCLSEPAADCALFCSSLRDTGLRALREGGGSEAGHLARIDALAAVFLDAYADVAPVSRVRVELWEVLDALTGVLHCWTKAKLGRLPYRLVLLDHALDRAQIA
jgi:Ser/Thr protein kinase RdoA (MazF antagonist)